MKSLIASSLVIYLTLSLAVALYLSHFPANRLVVMLLNAEVDAYPLPPNFSEINDTQVKKNTFFEYFSRIADSENQRLQNQRDILIRLKQRVITRGNFDASGRELVDIFASLYDVKKSDDKMKQLDELLKRVNIVPRALILAQAANESAWGTSRFSVVGNNYFGQWCFTQGCGIVPSNRAKHAKHEVQTFNSPAESVRAYLHNINTHNAYGNLRKIRAKEMKKKHFISGVALAEGLTKYSERGAEYISEIQHIIRLNDLDTENLSEKLGAK